MPAVPKPRPVCRVHRFGDQIPKAVPGVRICSGGHAHPTTKALYRCISCGFPITLPLET